MSCEVPFNVRKLLQVWAVLLTFSPAMSGYSWSSTVKSVLDHNPGLSPVFDDFTIREVEATEGQTLLLPCTVRYLGDKVVSWIRSKDLHILTSGPFTFSGDKRFEPVPARDFWGLRIRGVHTSDSGQYECQVNTDPKMSLAFNLTVSETPSRAGSNSKWVGQALIKGPREVSVRDGSPATFTCEISPLSAHSGGVFTSAKIRWLHDNRELLEASHPRISMKTLHGGQKVIGILKISEASWQDGGEYTCLQMSVKPDRVELIVVRENENAEAMQRDFPVLSSANQHFSNINLLLLIFLIFPT